MAEAGAGRFGARLFRPGAPPAGVAVALLARPGWLGYADGEGEVELDQASLGAAAAGFNCEQLHLTWQTPDGENRALVLELAQARALQAQVSQPLARKLAAALGTRRRMTWNWRFGGALVAAILALPLIALLVFVLRADQIAAWVVERIPPAWEQKLGELVLTQTRASVPLLDKGPAVEALAHMGQRLGAGQGEYRWFVARGAEVNAFAAPGGVVVVYEGLIHTAQSAEEVAGVLAHEIAHVELRHGLKAMVKGAGLRVMLSAVLGDYSALADGMADLTENKYSRDAEREADAHGLRMLHTARIDPRPMGDFFKRIAAEQEAPAVLALLSTHPLAEERLGKLEDAVAKAGAEDFQPLAVDWPAIQASLRDSGPR